MDTVPPRKLGAFPRRAVMFVAIVVISLAMDQGSKAWARTLPVPTGCTTTELAAKHCTGIPQPVIEGFWDWELTLNDGAAFSNFRGGRILLSLIAFGALVWIGWLAKRTKPEERVKLAAYALIASGAIGNLADRVLFGVVTDFVRWHHWPGIFNWADVALVIGVALLMLESVFARRGSRTLPA
jgi:signal peptidase II